MTRRPQLSLILPANPSSATSPSIPDPPGIPLTPACAHKIARPGLCQLFLSSPYRVWRLVALQRVPDPTGPEPAWG